MLINKLSLNQETMRVRSSKDLEVFEDYRERSNLNLGEIIRMSASRTMIASRSMFRRNNDRLWRSKNEGHAIGSVTLCERSRASQVASQDFLIQLINFTTIPMGDINSKNSTQNKHQFSTSKILSTKKLSKLTHSRKINLDFRSIRHMATPKGAGLCYQSNYQLPGSRVFDYLSKMVSAVQGWYMKIGLPKIVVKKFDSFSASPMGVFQRINNEIYEVMNKKI